MVQSRTSSWKVSLVLGVVVGNPEGKSGRGEGEERGEEKSIYREGRGGEMWRKVEGESRK